MPTRASTPATEPLADYRWLVSPAAQVYLARAAAQADPLARSRLLRCELTAERTRLVLEQVTLRERAAKKFVAAPELFFTPIGLEQATDGWIAAYKAARFPGKSRLVDFCCGIGGDLMALAAQAPAVGVDRDPVACLLAEANCRAALGLAGTASGCHDFDRRIVLHVDQADAARLTADDAWHIDPDRRAAGRRTTHVAAYNPPAETIDRMLSAAPAGAVKLAPAAEIPAAWHHSAEWEWISSARECRQLVGWFGPLASRPAEHRATLVSRTGQPPASFVGAPGAVCPLAESVGRYVFDPDPAVVAAGLIGAMAIEHGLTALVAGGAYLTADQPIDHPLLATFAVLGVMPWDVRRLKRLLRERRIGRLEVKQRGTRHDPATVVRELKVPGDQAATLILFRRGKSVVAILGQRSSHLH